ncbi:MAG: hypothetical protein ACK4SO_08285, partial [Candidatus Kapaibacteriota bacterium]
MSVKENRNIIIERVKKELLGPGSDIFVCNENFANEIIEGKPLQRYFTGILFPKQLQTNGSDNGQEEMKDEDEDDLTELTLEFPDEEEKEIEIFEENDEVEKTDTQPKYSANSFFPSHFGITFAVDKSCKSFRATINFGNYKKANFQEIKIPYNGEGIHFLEQFGLNRYVAFDAESKTLTQTQKLQRKKDDNFTPEYLHFKDCLKLLKQNTDKDFALYKVISKLFFKDKYKRNDNSIEFEINIADILSAENQHIELKLSELPSCISDKWPKELKENLVFHLKLYLNY